MDKPEQPYKKLLTGLQTWGWPYRFTRLKEDTLMVADKGFLDAFQRRFGTLGCPYTPPEKLPETTFSPKLKQIIVFLHKGEMALVHKLRQQHPSLTIYSALYDLAPQSIDWPLDFSHPAPEEPVRDKPIRILVSPPASDSEFICELMDKNKLGKPREAFGRPLATLLPHVNDLQSARYLENACRLNVTDDEIFLHIQTDALAALMLGSSTQVRHIRSFLQRENVSVIRVIRKDRIFQSSLSSILNRTRYRCVQHVPDAKRKEFSSRLNIAPWETLAALRSTTETEEILSDILAGVSHVLEIVLEDFAAAPEAGLSAIADFLGKAIPEKPETYDIWELYAGMPALQNNIQRQLRDVVDRIGLHASRL